MNEPYQAAPDVYVLPTYFPIPGIGLLPINAFVIMAEEPVLVDTGIGIEGEGFLKALRSVIAPGDLRWVWLTHDDSDHTGSIQRVMELAPRARLLTHALCAIRMSAAWPVPLHRVYALSPGESISVGDRKLMAIKPPLFDNPMSIGIYDDKSGCLFSVDSFGAILPGQGKTADDFPEEVLTQGIVAWHTIDSPWVHLVNKRKFSRALERIRQMAPGIILSGHLPPALGRTDRLLEVLASLPMAQPFVAPNQAVFGQIVAQMTAAPPGLLPGRQS